MRTPVSYAGHIGDTITLTGTVTTLAHVEGYRYNSPSQRVIVLDCGPHVAKTLTTAAWAYDVRRGDQLTLTGTVKAHQEYNE